MAKKDYSNLTREQLLEVIDKLEGKKKYGLVWDEERVPEKVVTDCQDKLPVLTAIKSKEITTDETQPTHILIEGDNYHALSVLNYTHKGKIDLIYIDPPYNTGKKDFIYNDDYIGLDDTWRHSKWINFMHSRLILAKELLKDDGFIVVSIDDNEIAQLKLLLDMLFNDNSKIVAVKMSEASGLKMGATKRAGNIPKYKEYVVFAKLSGIKDLHFDSIKKEDWDDEYNLFLNNFEKEHKDYIEQLSENEEILESEINHLDNEILKNIEFSSVALKLKELNITDKKEILKWKYDNSWRICRSAASTSVKKLADDKRSIIQQSIFSVISKRDKLLYIVKGDYGLESSKPRVQLIFASDNLATHPGDFWSDIKTTGLEAEGGVNFKNGKKPLELINRILKSHKNKDAIILDFFAGSGTTGHSVLFQNKKENFKRQFILCTNNESNNGVEKVIDDFCYPRIKNCINEFGNNLKYFKTSFVANNRNKDQLKIDITKKCTEMLCLKEGIYNLKIETTDYKIFQQADKYLAVYYDFANVSLEELKNEMNALTGEKILYCFTVDTELNKTNFRGWKNTRLEPIPQKILDVYKRIFNND